MITLEFERGTYVQIDPRFQKGYLAEITGVVLKVSDSYLENVKCLIPDAWGYYRSYVVVRHDFLVRPFANFTPTREEIDMARMLGYKLPKELEDLYL